MADREAERGAAHGAGARLCVDTSLTKSAIRLGASSSRELRHAHFGRDTEALIRKIREALRDKPNRVKQWRAAASVVVALLVLGWIGFVSGIPPFLPRAAQPDTQKQAEKEKVAATKAAPPATQAQAKKEQLAATKAEVMLPRAKADIRDDGTVVVGIPEEQIQELVGRFASKAEEEARARADNLVKIADTQINYREYDRAIVGLTEAIQLYPRSPRAFLLRGVAYERKGDNDRAVADYSDAIRLDPNDALAFCKRGNVKLKNNDASGNSDIEKAKQLDASACG